MPSYRWRYCRLRAFVGRHYLYIPKLFQTLPLRVARPNRIRSNLATNKRQVELPARCGIPQEPSCKGRR